MLDTLVVILTVIGLPALFAIFCGYMIFVVERDEVLRRRAEKEAKESKPRIILK